MPNDRDCTMCGVEPRLDAKDSFCAKCGREFILPFVERNLEYAAMHGHDYGKLARRVAELKRKTR